ncbi:sodium/glutamate symporter [Ornithinimicrobium sediminis]|uniref:sodium/glutamate symporter n=1 Tax=Ornithinimicrobium sediminis TaxID=2904603 RepID=UPI001E2B85B8|nr:sodium/glutamate symporter [Ornithinimicrobium sediminis]MCE0487081.1 sodium:glutamate symporter [Ornithinimicrobium sediminis]
MSAQQIGFALMVLGVFLLIGKVIRVKSGLVQRLFLPSSIIAGFILLFLGPQVLGQVMSALGNDTFTDAGLFSEEMLSVWSTLPGLLISIVFATLFLGQTLPTPRRAARLVGPQLSLGVALGSGQYVVGLLLAVAVLVPVFSTTPMVGALIEIGFEGGHGTAAGMRPVLEELGFEDGADLALGIATVGIVGGILLGIVMINWAVRTGRTEIVRDDVRTSIEEQKGLFAKDENYPAAMMTSRPASVEPLTLHMAIVALAILVGWLLLSGLQWVEQLWWADSFELFEFVPLFPLAMLGGVVVQLVAEKAGAGHLIDHQMMLRIQGLALDFLIVSALATLSIQAIGENLVPFLLLCAAGIALNVGMFLWLAPRIIPRYWFERGIGDFGQSMGVTATGLILMRIVDPESDSPAFEAFGYKQLVFEPFFGGGLITAASIPLIYQFGPWPLLVAMAALFVVAVVGGYAYYGREVRQGRKDRPAEARSGVG